MDRTDVIWRRTVLLVVVVSFISSPVISIVEGDGLRYSSDISLDDVDASFITEPDSQDSGQYHRYSSHLEIVGAGDVNGDGYDDILIGNEVNDEGAPDAGQAYLVFGGPSGWKRDIELSSTGASFIGNIETQVTGRYLGGGGDVNGDGYDDILIGTVDISREMERRENLSEDEVFNCEDGDTIAAIYLILGKQSGWEQDTPLERADTIFYLAGRYYQEIYSMDIVGDVNGDGYDDILFGFGGDNSAYMVLGRPQGFNAIFDLNASSDVSLEGVYDSRFGRGVAGVGDVNGDFLDDFLVSTHCWQDDETHSGQNDCVMLFFGEEDGWSGNVSMNVTDIVGASFISDSGHGHDYLSVAGAGDVNGDGYDDLLIGDPNALEYRDEYTDVSMKGRAYLYFGHKSGWKRNIGLLEEAIVFVPEGYADKERRTGLGMTFGGMGDVNGDGYDDFVLGAPSMGEEGRLNGKSYLFLGKSAGWDERIKVSKADASFVGVQRYEGTGKGLAIPGDLNGDGHDDIMIGTWSFWDEKDHSDRVKVYLIFPKKNTGPKEALAVRAYMDPGHTIEAQSVAMDHTLYIELAGIDGKSKTANIALVDVRSSGDHPSGLKLRLQETSKNSGVYGASLKITDRAHDRYGWIGTSVGETITISSIKDPAVNVTIPVKAIALQTPSGQIAVEPGEPFDLKYYTKGNTATTWEIEENADWLSWDNDTRSLIGDPDEDDLGQYNVIVRVGDGFGHYDEHEFTLVVNHRPVIEILAPKYGRELEEGEAEDLELRATAIDRDGEALDVKWMDNGEMVAEGLVAKVDLGPGHHEMTLEVSDGYHVVEQSVMFKVEPDNGGMVLDTRAPGPVPVLMVLVPLSIMGVVLVAFTEVGKYKTILALAPFYSKIKREAILDNFTRGKIYQYIVDHPGAHFNMIRKDLKLNNGTLTFHLNKLEKEGFIIPQKRGLRKCFYPVDSEVPSVPSTSELIMSSIRLNPGVSQKEVAKELDMSTSTVNDYIKRLKKARLIKVTKKGKTTRCYLVENG